MFEECGVGGTWKAEVCVGKSGAQDGLESEHLIGDILSERAAVIDVVVADFDDIESSYREMMSAVTMWDGGSMAYFAELHVGVYWHALLLGCKPIEKS